jgi:trehalose synthase-fused probable maltokinase
MASRAPSSDGREGGAAPGLPAALHGWLPAQRWFAAKSRGLAALTLVDEAAVPGTAGRLTLVRADLADGGSETYVVPLSAAPGAEVADALDDPGFVAALVELMRAGDALPGRRGTFRFAATSRLPDVLPAAPRTARPLGVEQSNTSRVVDDRAVLKLLRRLEPGLDPDLEITRFLTEETDFRDAPRLLGFAAYEARGGQAEPATVAMLQELIDSDGDLWSAMQASLAEYYATVGGAPDERAVDPAFAQAQAQADAKQARALGAVTGRLHMALASARPGSALAAEPITVDDLARWSAEILERLDRAAAALGAALDRLPAEGRGPAEQVLAELPRLRDGLPALHGLASEGVLKLRVHGDYHLGQVLRGRAGLAIVDFEGEPARPLAARRAKAPALRDVAGMLRSFAYAARSALLRAVEAVPDDPRLGERLSPWADAWEAGVREAFLEGYLAETLERGATFVPRRRDVLDAVLRAFELDKALYELLYELDLRPGWVRIPLEGLRRAARPPARPGPAAPRPTEAFAFVACLELREFVGLRAENERQLVSLLDQVPLDSIHFHTHGFLLRHRFAAGIYPNDFATWAAVHLRDQVLGERLAMVDPGEYPSLEALREELVAVVDDHLRGPFTLRAVSAEPFDFVRSRIVEIPTGVEVRTLGELRSALLEVDASAIYFHLVEARLRLGRRQNDFAAWLEALGLADLAARMRTVNPYGGSLERARTRLIHLCDQALAAGAR